MRFLAAAGGDRPSFEGLLAEIDVLSAFKLSRVLWCVNEYRLESDGDEIVSQLSARTFSPPDRVVLADGLLMGATHRLATHGFDSASLSAASPHPSYPQFVNLIAHWREEGDFDLDHELRMEIVAAKARIAGAAASLRRLATRVALQEDVREFENPLNGTIRTAIDELARQRQPLDLQVAIHLAENSDSNAEIGALYHIAAIGSREALDYLLERHQRDPENRAIIFQGVETVSTRLGLKVVEHTGELQIDAAKA
jgi:hypothetical protein